MRPVSYCRTNTSKCFVFDLFKRDTDQNKRMSRRQPIRTARRKAFRQDRLGTNAFCLFCGYACLESLTQVSRQWLEARGITSDQINRLLEDHHIFGEAHDPDALVTLCLNCHREITEALAREGVSMHTEKNLLKLIVFILRASAVLFESLAKSYRKWANLLEHHVEVSHE
jgi:hypothetical protein